MFKLLSNLMTKGLVSRQKSKVLVGTLNLWYETGCEGVGVAVAALWDEYINQNPQGSTFADGELYFISGREKMSVFDKNNNLIWKNGNYVTEIKNNSPTEENPMDLVPKGVSEAHWYAWCNSHYRVEIEIF